MKITRSLKNVAIVLMLCDFALAVFQLNNARGATDPELGKLISIVLFARCVMSFSLCGICICMATHALHGLKPDSSKTS